MTTPPSPSHLDAASHASAASHTNAASASRASEPAALWVPLDGYAREALERESAHAGISAQELAAFAVLYYLADIDSGRISRRIARSPLSGRPPEAG